MPKSVASSLLEPLASGAARFCDGVRQRRRRRRRALAPPDSSSPSPRMLDSLPDPLQKCTNSAAPRSLAIRPLSLSVWVCESAVSVCELFLVGFSQRFNGVRSIIRPAAQPRSFKFNKNINTNNRAPASTHPSPFANPHQSLFALLSFGRNAPLARPRRSG